MTANVLVGRLEGEADRPTRRTWALTAKAYRLLAILALNDGWTDEQRTALRRWKR